MKLTILTALFTCISLVSLYSQDLINGFKLDENKSIYWQNIVETNLDQSQIFTLIKESGNFENIELVEDKIICSFRPYSINYKSLGYRYMLTPYYISRSLAKANLFFEFRGDRYRVLIKNIVFVKNIEVSVGPKQGTVETLEYWVLDNKQNVKSNSFDYSSQILNSDFLIKTTFLEMKSDEW